ncbi:MAG: hypothetical protein RLO81_08670 [Fulvivirga sp.]|uniref:hypothetical protein n=1 Tax=Fulvivirga sp. TaxID=1931237 RepID=UPI0032ECE5EE
MINNDASSIIQTVKTNTNDARLLNACIAIEIPLGDRITLYALPAYGYPTRRFKEEGRL